MGAGSGQVDVGMPQALLRRAERCREREGSDGRRGGWEGGREGGGGEGR